MSSRNEETINRVRQLVKGIKEGRVLTSGGNANEMQNLLNEIDFRDMLISDLKTESTAYERGWNDGIQSLLPILKRCLGNLENDHINRETRGGREGKKRLLTELRVLIELGKANG